MKLFPSLVRIATLALAVPLPAADWYWDADADTSETTGGAGNWTIGGVLWRANTSTGTLTAYNDAAGPQNDAAANLILAGGTDSLTMTLTASTTYNLNRITANNTYTLATNTAILAFTGTSPEVNVASGKSLVWGTDLSAASSTVTKTGSGTWQFNNTGGQVVSSNTILDITGGTFSYNTSGSTANLFGTGGTSGTLRTNTGTTLSLVQTYNSGYVAARNWTLGATLNLNGGTFNAGSTNGALFMRLLNSTAIDVTAASTIAQSNGGFSQNFTIESAFTGSGNLTLNRAASNTRYLNLKGNMSGYSGNVSIGSSTAAGYVLFGNSSGWGTGNLSLSGAGSRAQIGDQAATEYNAGWTGGSALSFISGTFAPAGTITVGASSELLLGNTTAGHAIKFSPASGVTVNGGTLGRNGTLGSSVYEPAADTTWTFGGTALSTVSGPLSLANANVFLNVGDAVTTGNGLDTTVTGVLSGSQLLRKSGAGTLALANGSNTHDGGILVSNGAVRLTAAGALGASTSVTVENAENPGAQDNNGLELDGSATYGAGVTLTLRNNSTSNIGNARVRLLNQAGDNTWAGNIVFDQGVNHTLATVAGTLTVSGTVSQGTTPTTGIFLRGAAGTGIVTGTMTLGTATVTKTDGGTWAINSSGHTWGNTGVAVGTLRLGIANALPTGTSLSIGQADANNATFDLNGFDQTVANLSATVGTGGTKQITSSSSATLTIGNTVNNTYAGILGGAIAITKNGAGILTLSGTNSYTGQTTINAGTLQIGNGGTTGTLGAFDVINNATLVFNRSDDITVANNISGSGAVSKLGGGVLTLSGTNTYTGDTIIAAGVLSLSADSLADASAVRMTTGATLNLTHSTTDTVDKLFIDDVQQPGGLYNQGNSSIVTGAGSLFVNSGPPVGTPYESWLSDAGLTPGNPGTGKNESADGSGVENIVQFALGGDPTDPADNGVHAVFTKDSSASDNLVLTVAVRNGAVFSGSPSPQATINGITYSIQGSSDLSLWTHPAEEIAIQNNGGAITAPPGYVLKSFRLIQTPALQTEGFLRVKVE